MVNRGIQTVGAISLAGLTLSVASLLITAPSIPAFAQTPAEAPASPTPTGSYIVGGAPTAEELDKLLVVIRKLNGVEQVEVQKLPGVTLLRVNGSAQGTLILTAGRTAGFDLRQTPTRIYLATGPAQETDLSRLRAALQGLPGVEQFEMNPHAGGIALRVRGAIDPGSVAAAAKLIGFETVPVSGFVASGPTTPANVARLKAALTKLPGIAKIEMRTLIGGLNLVVFGDVKDSMLASTARSLGYGLLPVSESTGEKQRSAVNIPSIVTDNERNTPPAPNERTIDEQTRIGETAPDFRLLMFDGKGKITLSDSFGKRPIVLIFGSYT